MDELTNPNVLAVAVVLLAIHPQIFGQLRWIGENIADLRAMLEWWRAEKKRQQKRGNRDAD